MFVLAIVLLAACDGNDAAPDTGPIAPDCEDGLDGDEDGYVDDEDPDCEDGVGEEGTFNGPVVGLDMDRWVEDGFMFFEWSADEGWPASLVLTMQSAADHEYFETHPWPDVTELMVLDNPNGAYEPGVTTKFLELQGGVEYWELCAEHPLEDDPICVQGH